MKGHRILSDHLFTWSATFEAKNHVRFEKTAPGASAQTSFSDSHPPRLPYRTLQALWQARLQMRQGPRSRSQVLPVRKLSPFAPANGLCAAEVSRPDQEASCQLSARSRNLRGDLRNQSRTAAPASGTLRNPDERHTFLAHRANRSGSGRRPPCQYARGLARRLPRRSDHRGGDR
jgi:hypothetical protein